MSCCLAVSLAVLLVSVKARANTGRAVDEAGLDFATQPGFDSYVPTLYNDPANCTIGYGHLVHKGPCVFNRSKPDVLGGRGAYGGELAKELPYLEKVKGRWVKRRISKQEARDLLRRDAGRTDAIVNRYFNTPLSQNEFDALWDFTFNGCLGGSLGRKLIAAVNRRDFASAVSLMKRCNKGVNKRGKLVVMPGLVRRRKAEIKLFKTPDTQGHTGPQAHVAIEADGASFPGADPLTGFGIAAGFGTVTVSGGPTVQCHYNPDRGPVSSAGYFAASRCSANATRAAGSDVVLTARPDPNSRFVGWAHCPTTRWSGPPSTANGCTTAARQSEPVTWPSGGTFVAYFTGDVYKLSIDNTNPSQGMITSGGNTPSGDLVQCGSAGPFASPGTQCTAYEAYGSELTLHAESGDKPDFQNGCDTIISSPSSKSVYCELMMVGDRAVTASWTPFP